jgi:hypothetical protein
MEEEGTLKIRGNKRIEVGDYTTVYVTYYYADCAVGLLTISCRGSCLMRNHIIVPAAARSGPRLDHILV